MNNRTAKAPLEPPKPQENRGRRRSAAMKAISCAAMVVASGCSGPADRAAGEATAETDGAVAASTIDAGTDAPDAGTVATGGPDATADAAISDAARTDVAPDAGLADQGVVNAVADPELPGPYASTRVDAMVQVTATMNRFGVSCLLPEGAGPFAAVLVAHGFQLAPSQYDGYVQRLASFGYLACNVDFPASFRADHAANAQDIRGTIDWLVTEHTRAGGPLEGRVDLARIGVTGHSLGGKVTLLAAVNDARIRAYVGLDPVDTSGLCDATRCPDVSAMLPVAIPTLFIGETIDASGGVGGMSCAPATDNYTTFFDAANTPSLEFTLIGGNHMSFLDDPASCGLPCRLCQPATAPQTQTLRIARALMVAFFERHLRGRVEYDEHLTGPTAEARFVTPGHVTVRTR